MIDDVYISPMSVIYKLLDKLRRWPWTSCGRSYERKKFVSRQKYMYFYCSKFNGVDFLVGDSRIPCLQLALVEVTTEASLGLLVRLF